MTDRDTMTARRLSCFCGGAGQYWDLPFETYITCPHCKGTGTIQCKCTQATTRCGQ